jgi:protein-S-isoprenylcysteine O-methyltransferase Ste14
MELRTLACSAALVLAAYWVFRIVLPTEYERWGRLRVHASALELLIWIGYIAFPYLYNPPEWVYVWTKYIELEQWQWAGGMVLVTAGMVLAFGTMFWFGLRRAFGLQVEGLVRSGPYTWTRNPQLVLGAFMLIGVIVQRPSWYAGLWGLMALPISHWMVLAEEAHLRDVFGQEYLDYCSDVPRYLRNPFMSR